MSRSIKSLILPLLLGSTVLLSACSKEDPNITTSQSTTVQDLGEASIKEFARTADDQHDIQSLSTFDEKFTQMSDDMEDELLTLSKEGKLSDEFAQQRQTDMIQSALTMLADLELKTQQGRYIQGLMVQYWEQQAKLAAEQTGPVSNEQEGELAMQGLNSFLHAQEQLDNWREQYNTP